MSDHQETLKQTVARIEASFAKIDNYATKHEQYRVSAGKMLVELKVRIDAGEAGKGVKWWVWYEENFKNRSRRDAQRVMALARSDDPEAAAEKERTKNREATAARRELEKAAEAAATDGQSQWNEEDFAASIVRGVEQEVAHLQGIVDDLALVRELILSKLTFAFGGKEESAEAPKIIEEAKRGPDRPPGVKNKPKETPPASADPYTAKKAFGGTPMPAEGNEVDTEASAEARKKENERLAETEESPAAAKKPADDNLDLRGTFMDRRGEQPDEARP
jgi:hypothetical protein